MLMDLNNHHAIEHDHHDGDNFCPLCGNGVELLLSAADVEILFLAMTVGMGRADVDAVDRLLTGAINARLLNRVLDVALQGHLLPFDVDMSGEVSWRPTQESLSAAEIAAYHAELQRASAQHSDAATSSLLTGVERRQLALATAAGFRGQSQPLDVEDIVLEWAEGARDMAYDLDGILAGQLVPYIADDDPQRRIQVEDFEDLPDDEQVRYRLALDMLETSHNE